MYQLYEETADMSIIAERTNARPVTLVTNATIVRGFHFDPANMTEEDRDFVFRSVYPVGLEAFVQNPSTGMEKDIADHLFGTNNLLVLRSDGYIRFGGMEVGRPRPIGFCVWRSYETEVGNALYISGVAVNPSWQGKGFGRAMQQYALLVEDHKKKVDWAFMSTQNAVEKRSFDRAMGKESFPNTNGESAEHKEAGHVFAKVRGLGHYNPDTMELPNHYGGAPLYGIMPKCCDAVYEQLFARIDRHHGSGYLCVTKM